MMDKVMTLVSFSRKAGKLIGGFDAVAESVKKKKAELVLIASDASERTRESVLKILENFGNIRVMNTPYTMEEYFKICKKDYAVLAIEDRGFADAICKLLEEELL